MQTLVIVHDTEGWRDAAERTGCHGTGRGGLPRAGCRFAALLMLLVLPRLSVGFAAAAALHGQLELGVVQVVGGLGVERVGALVVVGAVAVGARETVVVGVGVVHGVVIELAEFFLGDGGLETL